MNDLTLKETGDGGDLTLLGNDLLLTSGIFNQIYMALFGGNPEASTTGNELITEQRQDWWGNALLSQDKPAIQQNSETEKALGNVAITSAGRLEIEEAVKSDLKFLNEVAQIGVDTSILAEDKIEISILAQEPNNEEEQAFVFSWDATKEEIIYPEMP